MINKKRVAPGLIVSRIEIDVRFITEHFNSFWSKSIHRVVKLLRYPKILQWLGKSYLSLLLQCSGQNRRWKTTCEFKEIINIHLKINNCNNHKKKKTLSFYFSKEKPQFTSYSCIVHKGVFRKKVLYKGIKNMIYCTYLKQPPPPN